MTAIQNHAQLREGLEVRVHPGERCEVSLSRALAAVDVQKLTGDRNPRARKPQTSAWG
jgi:hypothetical protein